jgi:hypothetical protein
VRDFTEADVARGAEAERLRATIERVRALCDESERDNRVLSQAYSDWIQGKTSATRPFPAEPVLGGAAIRAVRAALDQEVLDE